MSLIHEALKKVERQRQLGAAPTLDSPRFQRRRRRWPWLLLLVLVVLVAGAWTWRGPLVHKARSLASHFVTSNQAGTGEEAATQAVSGDHSPGVAPSKPIASEQAKPAADESTNSARPSADKAAATPRSAAQSQPKAQPIPNELTPVHAQDESAQSEVAAASKTGTPTPSAAAPDSAGVPKPAAQLEAGGQPSTKGPPMYWELPYALRRDIPELSISMHMYTEKPADRFVIINGERQVEGDTLLSGLKLIAINPDSITVDKDGQNFQVPRRGSH